VSDGNFYNSFKEIADKHAEALFGDRTWPDEAFIVERGATKDADGNTLQKFRKLPHHNKNVKDPNENSSIDLPHLRNALARVSQISTIKEDKTAFIKRATSHLQKHAKALLKSYQKSSSEFNEIEAICAEFDIPLDESNANIKIMKNGTDDKPYCMVQDGKKLMCHTTLKEAQDHMNKMMK